MDLIRTDDPPGGFTLFGDLEMDLDIDPTMDALFSETRSKSDESKVPACIEATPSSQTALAVNHLKKVGTKHQTIALDPSLPFFFPSPENSSKDIAHVLDAQLSQKFYKTETS